MPSQQTAKIEPKKETLIQCEVLRAIGIDATQETIEAAKNRADTKGLRFSPEGLTTMIYPSKKVIGEDGKTWVPGEPVYIDLPKDVAKKLQSVNAVRVVIK